ncbi:MAG: hypothetical protein HYY17_03115 [Planctomycetes bacterium]|nr:hypothetical protein [Planctomycetota bacterium]
MAKPASAGDRDFFGLLALGSLVGNVVQTASGKDLPARHQELRAYAGQLQHRYHDLVDRYRIAAGQYAILREENVRLWNEVQQFHELLQGANRRNDELARENTTLHGTIARLEAQIRKQPNGGRT